VMKLNSMASVANLWHNVADNVSGTKTWFAKHVVSITHYQTLKKKDQ